MWLAVVLVRRAGLAFVLIGRHGLPVGDSQPSEQPTSIMYGAAGISSMAW